MILRVAVILQTDIVGGGTGASQGAAALVRRDAGEDEEGEFEDSVWACGPIGFTSVSLHVYVFFSVALCEVRIGWRGHRDIGVLTWGWFSVFLFSFVAGGGGGEEGFHIHQKSQENIRGDLQFARRVDLGFARLAPEIPVVARDITVELQPHGLPPPEPAPAYRQHDGRDAEGPDDEVSADVPAGVDGFAKTIVAEEEEGEGYGVVEEGDEDLYRSKKVGQPEDG